MSNTQTRPANIIQRMFKVPSDSNASGAKQASEKPRYTLRVEDGMIHINNISGTPEGVMYTLMAENNDGSTKLMTRYVALAPFQAFADEVEGGRVLAAWEKN